GVLLGDLLARIIGRSVGGGDRFAATLVRWATIALAAAMGLRFMGLADEIVILAFGLILGSAAVAAALAFGLGGREAAQRLLRRWLD
ncbi:mechanosensitive ion channel, partial [Escherichia coli]|uniref:mechanosensitive ion channel n=3 Tax=Pseudomonadota TaxID=1224 RepID=UPI0028E090C5